MPISIPKCFDTAFVKKEKPGKKVSMRIVGFIMDSGISEAMAPRSGVSLYVEFIMSQIFVMKLRDEFVTAEGSSNKSTGLSKLTWRLPAKYPKRGLNTADFV